jgi:IS4 transposase
MNKQTLAHVVADAFSSAADGASSLASRNATVFRVGFFMMLWVVLTLVLVADLFVTRAPLNGQAQSSAQQIVPSQPHLLALGPTQ